MKFGDANIEPYISTGIATAPKSDAERIADARTRAMTSRKESVAALKSAGYDMDRDPSFYKDFAGPETSAWDAQHWRWIAETLEAPILERSKYVWTSDLYDAWTGTFNLSDAPGVSIAELKTAVNARIVELHLSAPLIWEYLAVPHGSGSELWREDLATRIERFKV